MKKFILSLALLAFVAYVAKAEVYSTNYIGTGVHLAISSRANVMGITVSSTNNVALDFFDNSVITAQPYGTNYVTASYISSAGYTTNIVTSYVGINGFTNWYTNTGYFTYSVTNAAGTNRLVPTLSMVNGANMVTSQAADALFTRGVSIFNYGVGGAAVIIQYNTGK